jgi:predicted CxxxxCH...CXXCH cytochrome family protein
MAEITFGPLARKQIIGGVIPNPQWNSADATCSNVYCHGKFNGGNQENVVTFNNPGSAVCGSCHGNPTTGNPKPSTPTHTFFPNLDRFGCAGCHRITIDSSGTIVRPDLHVNGEINFSETP